MTIKELKEILNQYDEDTIIKIENNDYTTDDIQEVKEYWDNKDKIYLALY